MKNQPLPGMEFKTFGNAANMLDNWHKKEEYLTKMGKNKFKTFTIIYFYLGFSPKQLKDFQINILQQIKEFHKWESSMVRVVV